MATSDVTPLSLAQRSKIRRLSAPREVQAGEEAGELNIVPYLDIIMNIMMFVLASVTVAFTATIDTSAAYAGPKRPAPHDGPPALRLTALITHQGIVLTTASGGIAPGCSDLGAGVTIPNKAGTSDLAGLAACARRIKGVRPEYALESQVSLSANPDVPYETLVAVMDTLRADATGELFPEVQLGVVR